MKKTLTLVGLGASVLLAFPSCKSTDSDGFFGDTEEAVPMSFVGDDEAAPWEDEIPGWMMQDSGSAQVSAGETTILPAPDEPVADNGGSVSARQNRPDVAVNDSDVLVENDAPLTGVDPLSGTPVSDIPSTPAVTTPATSTPKPVVTTTTQKKTTSSTGKKSGTSASGGKKTASTTSKKPGKKISKPTLVVYKVRPGDNLSTIAKRSNTTVAQIRKDSGIKGDVIHPGQTIKVRYTPKDYKAPAKNTAKNNGKTTAKNNKGKNTTATTSSKGSGSYTVRSGETISSIAKKNGVSTAAILKANGMTNADAVKMRPGKKLVIPKK